MAKEQSQLSEFFNALSSAYDQSILRGCPPYVEMLEALVGYLFLDAGEPLSILELGCGTGNVSRLILERFPKATLTVVDLSEKMLQEARQKVHPWEDRLNPIEGSFSEVTFEPGTFDAVVSSMALHHISDAAKALLYRQIFQWLNPGGRFRCADQCLSEPVETAHAKNIEDWLAWSRSVGATEEELQMWLDHARTYDQNAPLHRHFQWLSEAGFVRPDCYWRKLYWTVFGADKLSR